MTALALALLLSGSAAASEKTAPPAQVLDVGSFRVKFVPPPNWKSTVVRKSACVIFQYVDEPAETLDATIGVFRSVVPPAARAEDRVKIAAAYATLDVSGAQQALFKSNAHLALLSPNAKTINGGQLLSYAEPIDANGRRAKSTKFVRAWIFFPRSYAETGALYLVLGREQSSYMEIRPAELDKAEEIIAGIREP